MHSPTKTIVRPGNLIFAVVLIDQIGPNQPKKSFKFLGLNVDQNLDREQHNSITASKINSATLPLIKVKTLFLLHLEKNLCLSYY